MDIKDVKLSELPMNDKMTLIPYYAIEKYEKEEVLVEKLKNILPDKVIFNVI